MSLAVEKLDGSMAKLTITVPAEEFTKAITSAYNKQKSKFSVPGFRKGKVPQAFIEKMYGAAIFYEDAANQLINEYYPKELENCEEEITSNPEIDVTQIEKGKDFIFTATVAVKPEIKIGDYKGVEIEKIDTTVTDEDVMAEILKDQKENGRKIDVTDRAAQMDDEVTINFEGFVDDVAFEGGKGENYKLTLGSHSFIDTFEDQIVGKNIGDKFDVNVTFPEEYHVEDLKGKPAVFKVELLAISTLELPELDDEFASDVSSFETFAEYKEDKKKTLEVKKEEQAKREKEARKNQRVVEIKEIRLTPNIDIGDLNTKVKNACRFLKDGDKVKVSVRFRGREVTHSSLGQDLLHRFAELCSECSTVEKQPKLEGRQMLMFLAPAKDK